MVAQHDDLVTQRDEVDGGQRSASPRAVAQPVGRPLCSIVAPLYNEEETVPHFYACVVAVMEGLGEPFELVLVNDGSHDRSLERA